jgi:hypothetical protein
MLLTMNSAALENHGKVPFEKILADEGYRDIRLVTTLEEINELREKDVETIPWVPRPHFDAAVAETRRLRRSPVNHIGCRMPGDDASPEFAAKERAELEIEVEDEEDLVNRILKRRGISES